MNDLRTGQYSDDRSRDYGGEDFVDHISESAMKALEAQLQKDGVDTSGRSDDEIVEIGINRGYVDEQALHESWNDHHPEVAPDNPNPPQGLDTPTAEEAGPAALFTDMMNRHVLDGFVDAHITPDSPLDPAHQWNAVVASDMGEIRRATIEGAKLPDDPTLGDADIKQGLADEAERQLAGRTGSPLSGDAIRAQEGAAQEGQALRDTLTGQYGYAEADLLGRPRDELRSMIEWHRENPTDNGTAAAGAVADRGGTDHDADTDAEVTSDVEPGATGGSSTARGESSEPRSDDGTDTTTTETHPSTGGTASTPPSGQPAAEADPYAVDVDTEGDGEYAPGASSSEPSVDDFEAIYLPPEDVERRFPDHHREFQDEDGQSGPSGDQTSTNTSDRDVGAGESSGDSGSNDSSDDGSDDDDDDDDSGDGDGDNADTADDTSSEDEQGTDDTADTTSDAGTPHPDGDVPEDPEARARFEETGFGRDQRQDQIDAIEAKGGRLGSPDESPSDADRGSFFDTDPGAAVAEDLRNGVEDNSGDGVTDPHDLDVIESGRPVVELKVTGNGLVAPGDAEAPIGGFGDGAPAIDTPGIAGPVGGTRSFDDPDAPDDPDNPNDIGVDTFRAVVAETADSASYREVSDVEIDVTVVERVETDVDLDLDVG
ncbi:MAG: hypothetical protein AAGD33_03515 [Actinomycetota bacterium]